MSRGAAGPRLDRESLDSLLAFLDEDRTEAARRYEEIRHRLTRLFAWRGCSQAEELADETMDRVARKLAAGLEVRAADPYRYFTGVAHLIFKEMLRREMRERAGREAIRHLPPPAAPPAEDERRLHCLQRCLHSLAPESRELIIGFYQGEQGVRIRHRKSMAARLRITVNALRIRAHRLRAKLEVCVRQCLASNTD